MKAPFSSNMSSIFFFVLGLEKKKRTLIIFCPDRILEKEHFFDKNKNRNEKGLVPVKFFVCFFVVFALKFCKENKSKKSKI